MISDPYADWREQESSLAAHCLRSTGVPVRVVRLVDVANVVGGADGAAPSRAGPRLNLKKLFEASYERTFCRSWLILHAWEWLPLVAGLAWLFRENPWVTGAAIGWLQHLLADQLVNTPNRWAYSIIWRWRHGFDHQKSFPFHER